MNNKININTFTYLFNEIVRIKCIKSPSFSDFEKQLHQLGHNIGFRIVDVQLKKFDYRLNNNNQEKGFLNVLNFIVSSLWLNLFGHKADPLEISQDGKYMIYESEFIVNKYSTIDCGEFIAGIVDGFLVGTGFKPKNVYSGKSVDKRNVIVISI